MQLDNLVVRVLRANKDTVAPGPRDAGTDIDIDAIFMHLS
jgi:hypothetical protein